MAGCGLKACKITSADSIHQLLSESLTPTVAKPARKRDPMQPDLPIPSPDALEHSAKLRSYLREQIVAAGGWINFADYMDSVLYAPSLGYYSAGASKFGEAGDFVTAPEISSVFSKCMAGQCAEVLAATDGGVVLELGAGTGVMAADMLLQFERIGLLPDEYLILESSADLRERQLATISERADHLCDRVRWLDNEPTEKFRGVVVGNEVLDALPVRRFILHGDLVEEQGVEIAGDDFVYRARPADDDFLAAVDTVRPFVPLEEANGYTSELCSQLPAWLEAVTGALSEGVVLLLDYGFPRHEYYLAERSSGTLRCYYRHRAHEDPFLWPGLQDITAWVNFSQVAEAAAVQGFDISGFTTQANFLLAAGIEVFMAESGDDVQAQVEMAHGLKKLLLPGEMGESVKVISLSRGGVAAPQAMHGRDLRNRL